MWQRIGREPEGSSAISDAHPRGLPDGASVLLLGAVPPHVRSAADRVAPSIMTYAIAQRLLDALASEAVAVVCGASALDVTWLAHLGRWVSCQPAWSDLQFVVLMDTTSAFARRPEIQAALGNVAFVTCEDEAGLLLVLEAASRARVRQWLLRDLLAVQRDAHAVQTRQRVEAAAQSENNIRAVLETTHQYQGLLDIDGAILYANRVALEGVEATLEEVLGRPFWDSPWFSATPGAPERLRQAVAAVAAGEVIATTLTLRLPAGERIYEFSLRPVFDSHGAVVAMVPEGFDITARVLTENSLRQAQKMEAIGQLTGGVAHDFNNLLTVIKSSSDLLKRPDLPQDRREKYINAISETADRAAKLTSHLLAFARRQELQPEIFDASASVIAVGEMMATLCGSRIRLTFDLPDGACLVDADPSQFDTALVNLVVNARDAMAGTGQISVCIERREVIPRTRAHPEVEAPCVAISVQDNGAGLPPEMLERIFEPFFTTKKVGEGTGLGLSQVLGFAKQSGGEVIVESRVGEGSTFTLYLRRVDAPAADEAASSGAARTHIKANK